MKHFAALLIGVFFFASPLQAETPCDFKGISVGDRMKPAEIMAALGITKYKTNPARSFDMTLVQKYGIIPAGEIEDWKIGPHCDETSCRIPYGVEVGNNNTPVNVLVAFRDDLITEIDVSFSQTYWDEILPILNQKYGADWRVEREYTPITNFETNKTTVLEGIFLKHVTNGTNPKTKRSLRNLGKQSRYCIRAPRRLWAISLCVCNQTHLEKLLRETEKQVPKAMIGRRLSQEEAKRLLAKFE